MARAGGLIIPSGGGGDLPLMEVQQGLGRAGGEEDWMLGCQGEGGGGGGMPGGQQSGGGEAES